MKSLLFHCLLLSIFNLSTSNLSKSDLDKNYKIRYIRGATAESDLAECQDIYSPCSVIKNPFFFPFVNTRLCRCKKKACPDTFDVKKSLDTVFVNNREQIKFCQELPKCHGGWGILRVGAEDDFPYHLNCYCAAKRRYWRLMNPDESAESTEEQSITLDDHLQDFEPDHHHRGSRFKRHGQRNETHNSAIPIKMFKCEKMEPCAQRSCGTVRTDFFATYQNCTCAANSLCLPSRSLTQPISEVLNSYGVGKYSLCVRRLAHSTTAHARSSKWNKIHTN